MNEDNKLITNRSAISVATLLATLATRFARSASESTALRWQWLLSPSVERLQQLLALAPITSSASEMKNTSLWFSFFDPSFHASIHNQLPEDSIAFDDADAFTENLLIRVLIARRDGDREMEKQLSNILERMDLSAEPAPEKLAASLTLISSVEQVIRQRHEPEVDCEILVHSPYGKITIRSKEEKKTIISPTLCSLIELFSRHPNLTYEETLQGVFGIPRYDGTIHYAKIQNLLNRLRTLSRSFAVQTKDGRIYARTDWTRIHLTRASSHQFILLKQRNLPAFRRPKEKQIEEPKAGKKLSLGRLRSSLGCSFTRRAFETATGLPRSTAARYLKSWLSQQILTKEGAGKATLYRFLQN